MKQGQWLDSKKQFKAKRPGEALARWLNEPDLNPKNLIELLTHAQVVYRWKAEHPNPQKKPLAFWDSFQKANGILENFSYSRQLDVDELADGNGLRWTLVAEDQQIGIPLPEVTWLGQLMEEGKILRIRRCEQCASWFFAHFSHQVFCKEPCRIKHISSSDKFKEKRRKYMRDYYKKQTSTNVK